MSDSAAHTSEPIPGPDPGACPKCGQWRKAGMLHDCPGDTAAMTHDQRRELRRLIDQAKRQQLANHKPPPGRNQAARRATYRAYYQRNRTRILARRAASRAA